MGDRQDAEVQLRRPVRLLSLRANMDKEMGMEEDIVTRLRKEAAMAFEDDYGVWPPESSLMKEAASEIETLRKYKSIVYYIVNDYHELSYEKSQWQRDDWKRRCIKLIEEDDG